MASPRASIRLAHRVFELYKLPFGLAEMPSVIGVRQMYERSFIEVATTPKPDDEIDEERFTSMLEAIRKRHETVVVKLARGVLELKEHDENASVWNAAIKNFLDSFL